MGVNSKADSVSIRRPDFQVPFFQGVTLVFFGFWLFEDGNRAKRGFTGDRRLLGGLCGLICAVSLRGRRKRRMPAKWRLMERPGAVYIASFVPLYI